MRDQTMNRQRKGGGSLSVRRADVLHSVTRLSIIGLLVLMGLHAVVHSFSPEYPFLALFAASVFVMIVLLLTLYLLQKRKVDLAVTVFFAGTYVGLAPAVYFLGGLTGPLMPGYWALLLFAGFIGGQQTMKRLLFPTLTLAGGFLLLESLGWIPDVGLSEPVLRFLHFGVFAVVIVITIMILTRFQRVNEESLEALESRRVELAQAIMDAETARRSESKAREQEVVIGQRLRQRVDEYVAYLQRVVEGDYEASLDLPEEAAAETTRQLIILGRYLKQTVAALVDAIEEAESTQRLYVRQSWEALRESKRTPTGYRYGGQDVEVDEEAWLPLMDEASARRELILDEETQSLAIPLSIRDQVIGVIGLERDQGNGSGWHREDLALIQDVVDQLAQTIDRLRLLDDISRSAALEQTIGEVTSHIRAEVEIESVVERTLTELAEALDAERGAIQLSFEREEEVV